VHKTVNAAKINEGTKVNNAGYNPLADLSLFKLIQEAVTNCTL